MNPRTIYTSLRIKQLYVLFMHIFMGSVMKIYHTSRFPCILLSNLHQRHTVVWKNAYQSMCLPSIRFVLGPLAIYKLSNLNIIK